MGFTNHEFKGKATANPFVPALFGSYKHDKWAIGLMAGIVGSGGKVTYDEGVPQFVIPVRAMMGSNGLAPNMYTLDAYMQGKQYIYGVQANFTYRLNDHWAVAAGLRGNIYSGFNRGHVISNAGGAELLNMQIDVDQKGFGMAPLLSLNYRWKGLTLTGRYEFRTKLNIPNDTKAQRHEGAQCKSSDCSSNCGSHGCRLSGWCEDALRHARTALAGRGI